mmetsp:Transcript_19595/g.61370  ORF Transcript_19595/g.61370 Transcript_19595/m.61370 type:complete len:341 (-) Transcript_19595:1034-2056(-)
MTAMASPLGCPKFRAWGAWSRASRRRVASAFHKERVTAGLPQKKVQVFGPAPRGCAASVRVGRRRGEGSTRGVACFVFTNLDLRVLTSSFFSRVNSVPLTDSNTSGTRAARAVASSRKASLSNNRENLRLTRVDRPSEETPLGRARRERLFDERDARGVLARGRRLGSRPERHGVDRGEDVLVPAASYRADGRRGDVPALRGPRGPYLRGDVPARRRPVVLLFAACGGLRAAASRRTGRDGGFRSATYLTKPEQFAPRSAARSVAASSRIASWPWWARSAASAAAVYVARHSGQTRSRRTAAAPARSRSLSARSSRTRFATRGAVAASTTRCVEPSSNPG